MLIAILEDRVFRRRTRESYTKRWTVRCIAYNQDNELVFLRIKGTDALGMRDHLETIGGGVENEESLEDALIREVREEIGYSCTIEKKLGYIVDHYNVLNRETISTYFIIRLNSYIGGEERSEQEKVLMHGLETYTEEEAIKKLGTYMKRTANELVQRRDYMALRYYMENK